MRFYEFENEWAVAKGVWCSKEQPDDKWDYSLEIVEMELRVSETDGEDDYEFRFTDWESEEDWYLPITIPDGEKFGTPKCCTWKVYDTDTHEFMGWVHVDDVGNKTENILLGLYDLIEGCYKN